MRAERSRVIAVLLLTGLLFLPGLYIGFAYDYFFLAALEVPPGLRSLIGPYFVNFGDPVAKAWWQAHGFFLWWADEGFRWTLLRPLSVALLRLQWQCFGREMWAYHIVSIAIYLVLVRTVWSLYRRVLSSGAALLALLLFATHFAHMQTVWFVLNQHSVLAVLPALLGLIAHLRWREEGWRPGRLLSLLGISAGMLASETALAVVGYLVAYELFAAEGSRAGRIRNLVPVAALVILYLTLHHTLGYTTRGSLLNLDPAGDPLAFLAATVTRLPPLVAGLFGVLPADLFALPAARPLLRLAAAIACLQVAFLLRAAWGTLEPSEQRTLRWTGAGAVFSLIPVIAAEPGGRLLLCATLGSSILLAVLVRYGWRLLRNTVASVRRRTYLIVLAPLVLVNLVLAPLVMPVQQLLLQQMTTEIERSFQTAEIDDTRLAEQELIVLTTPGPMIALNFMSGRRVMTGRPVPRAYWVLSCEPFAHRVTRTGPDRLELEVIGGHMIAEGRQWLFRPRAWPLRPGDEIDQGSVHVRILETDGAGPTRVEFRFKHSLEDSSYQVLAWKEGRLQRVSLPPVGGQLFIPLSASPYGRWL